jgi:hypothetical protein
MPRNALEAVDVDYSLPLSAIAGQLHTLAQEAVVTQAPVPDRVEAEMNAANPDDDNAERLVESAPAPRSPARTAAARCGS